MSCIPEQIGLLLLLVFEGVTSLPAGLSSPWKWKTGESSLELQNADRRRASFSSIHFLPRESAEKEHSGIPYYLISASNINGGFPPLAEEPSSGTQKEKGPPPQPDPISEPKWKSKLKFRQSAAATAELRRSEVKESGSSAPGFPNQIPIRRKRNKRFLEENNSYRRSQWDLLSPFRKGALICEICVLMDSQFEQNYGGPKTLPMLEAVLDKVSWIFRTVDWNEDGMPDNIGFRIQSVQRNWNLLPEESPGKYFQKKDGRDLLFVFGLADYAHCCLALGLTMRPFLRNEVAVSIRGERRHVGGICEYRGGSEPGGTNSLNLILISGSGPGGFVLDRGQLEMTLLHELGHSFGSTHDYNLSHSGLGRDRDTDDRKGEEDVTVARLRECSGHDPKMVPVGDRRVLSYPLWEPVHGRFIMWPSSPQGKRTPKKNNFRFSPCSKKRVMEILTSSREFCFIRDLTPFCGNGILEETEECDCGNEVDCLAEACCGHRQSQRPCQLLNPLTPCPGNVKKLEGNAAGNFTFILKNARKVGLGQEAEEDGRTLGGVFKLYPNFDGLSLILTFLLVMK